MLRVSGRLEKILAETLPNRNHPRSGIPMVDGHLISHARYDETGR
jgi:hypothetical protein